MQNITQVIAAISTPPGKGGVAIIRMSGDEAFSIAEKVFRPINNKDFMSVPPRFACYGHILDGEEKIDDVLLTKFPAPNSYTGENTVEIACHGGILVTKTILELLFANGAAAAEAGEFTKRAFINGKLSLTDAEAIGSLLEAESRAQIRLSSDTSRSALSAKITQIRAELLSLMSSVYARIDYPDEDLGDFDDEELLYSLYKVRKEIHLLLSTYKTGKAVTSGIKTVICGKPNVGKSSFYNLLLGEEAAIVTDIEGTTRDVLERSVPLGQVMLRLADTAGIRSGEKIDAVEQIGIGKSIENIEKSELIFAIFDLSREFDEQDELLLNLLSKSDAPKIAILNKTDKPRLFSFDDSKLGFSFDCVIEMCAAGDCTDTLCEIAQAVDEMFTDERISLGQDAVISSARQNASLTRAFNFTNAAIESLEAGFMQDAASSDVERALGAISELDGRSVSEEIVSDIFSKFCVGK